MPLDFSWYGRAYLKMSYVPRDFRDEMGRYADAEGSECPFVSSGYRRPSYSVLEPDALAYYLWWRTNARRGRVLKADEGHVWLFMTELVNAGDPASNLGTMIDVIRRLPYTLMSRDLASLPMGYALSRGLPPEAVPREAPLMPSRHQFLRDLTRYPMRMPDARILRACADEKWLSGLDDDAYDSVAEVVGLSLAGIDELVRSTQGRGLLRYLGCRTVVSEEGRIRGFGDWSGIPAADPPELDPYDPSMRALMEGVIRTATRFMTAPGTKAPSPPKTFPREYAEVVAAAVDAVTLGDPWDPRSFRRGDGGFWEDDDAMLSPAVRMPRIVEQRWPSGGTPRLSMKDIGAHWSENPAPGARYVPSGATRTSYSAMNGEQLGFYLSWRSGARRGIYSDIDEGYLWLYCSELLAMASDHVEAQRELDRAIRAYRRSIDRWSLESECLLVASAGHALLHGLEPEPAAVSQIPPSLAAYLTLASEPTWRMDPAMAEVFAPSARVRVQDPDGLYEGAFTAAVRAVDGALRRVEGRRLVDLGRSRRSATVTVYAGLWSNLKTSEVFPYTDVLASSELLDIMEGTLKAALRTVNKRTGGSAPRVPKGFPKDLLDAAESAVAAFLDGLDEGARRERGRREAESMVLDRAAVDAAAADLDAVTGMMAAGGEEEESEEAPAELPEPEDPWEALASSLDGTERAFVLASLEGDGPSALRGAGRRLGEVESSINAKAMDRVGDAVMEDGVVYEEYEAEIRRVLG